ncbi:TPA: hypothetical protein G5V04_004069 [Salmonella enterica]|nr:hypothetical protein [Salmonella enterica]
MTDQEINILQNKVFKLEQGVIGSSIRSYIAYNIISFVAQCLTKDDKLNKLISEYIEQLEYTPPVAAELPEMHQSIFEAEKKIAISVFSLTGQNDAD